MYLCQRKVIVQVRSWQQQIAYLLSHDYVTERYYLLTHCTTAYFDVLSRPCIAQFYFTLRQTNEGYSDQL